MIENYLKKFGSVQDVKNMTELFIHLNTRFPFYTTNKYLKEGEDKAQWLYCLLLTWGIILNNKDSSLVKKSFLSFCRPVHSYISKQIEKKKELIRRLYKGKKIQSLANINYIFRQTKKARKIVICLILHNQYYKNNDIG